MTPTPDYGGYALSSVTWGYRDIFSKTIQRLFDEGYLGPEREEITRQFFSLLRCSEAGLYDHVLKEFLDSLTGESAWIFDLPAIFGEIIRIGSQFSEAKMFYGIEFYRILKDGGFGDSPEHVQFLLTWLKRLGKTDMELAFGFLKGYQTMLARLKVPEIQHYIEEGLRLFKQNTQMGIRFLECRLGSSETYFQELTRESRLEDVAPVVERLLRALTGMRIHAVPLSGLETDQIIARGSGVVCLPGTVAFPERVRRFTDKDQNYHRYILATICASAHVVCRAYPHSLPISRLVGDSVGRKNLVAIVEHLRALEFVLANWPGAGLSLRHAFDEEFGPVLGSNGPEALLADLCGYLIGDGDDQDKIIAEIREIAAGTDDIEATARAIGKIGGGLVPRITEIYPDFSRGNLKPVSFLPDLLYEIPNGPDSPVTGEGADDTSGQTDTAAPSTDLTEGFEETDVAEQGEEEASGSEDRADDGSDQAEPEKRVPFFYDEWSNEEGAYYRAHCSLYEVKPQETDANPIPEALNEQVAKVRRIFEMLKPVVINKIKRLSEGDEINHDLLVQYLVDSKSDPSPKVDFYERPLVNRRDLSVLVLLDISGSTDEEVDGGKILDIEKQAALILGQGLASLGDSFSLCGFNSNGRENCRYHVFKDFDDEWGEMPINSLFSALPSSSTRIGVALRHAGRRLQEQPSRQRLIILITDGRPMDQGYDPETRYAQYDVRMACEENRKSDILTFCVSTMDNSRADMEIMFPERRFVILKDIGQLPKVLPQLYIRLTT